MAESTKMCAYVYDHKNNTHENKYLQNWQFEYNTKISTLKVDIYDIC